MTMQNHASADGGGGGSDGGAWLDGEDADAIVCDAAMAPVVIGEVNPAALEVLVRLCVQLDGLRHRARDDAKPAPRSQIVGCRSL
jgi:hypothetical protein